MINIEMLPAAHGDCLWVEWENGPKTHRMLIDGGPASTYPKLLERLHHLPADQREFELLVITHVDADHIEGIVRLLLDAKALNVRFNRVWFNGRPQLDKLPGRIGDDLGAVSGEYLSMLLDDLQAELDPKIWNTDFDEGIVRCDATSEPPTVEIGGGLKLTIVSPDLERLHDLDDKWEKELAKAKIEPGSVTVLRRRLEDDRRLRPLVDELGGDESEDEPQDEADPGALEDELGGGDGSDRDFGDDKSPANGSSIAFIAEWADGTTVLFSGDAFPAVMQTAIEAHLAPSGETKLDLDAFKVPHHGSVGNVTEELLALLKCDKYLISSSGALFRHPHAKAVELLATNHNGRAKPRLYFNYLSEFTEPFIGDTIADVGCVTHYPAGGTNLML